MKRSGSARDPLWYKDAIIYETHVRAFHDANGDGIGDFAGLTQKLDYLSNLGITCIWLLPFFPSPLHDDGYDIADYIDVHPSYGTREDFKTFLNAAHERNLQVMIELVMNHTSDQHPWFQRARQAPSGSPDRDFYVWSDTDEKYRDVRIIFTDTERSNWSWDPVARQYYWHRFFSHQPDLNFDNPSVQESVLEVMRHWLDLGVDALRLDAVPYLVEREGTSCENLAETHAVIRRFRREMDEHYSGRMILAEANQWPPDVRPYFGDGDECHMAFHFPLMPRIFMALRLEDALPITDILSQTPGIPDSCQWGLFLRNHDELTLEMVTDEERDYMYFAYSADPRMRLNIGIRRRLAPLMDNNRRRIELLNSLLFSLPGTPILYYGDEIGMGDNIYLGDRNGVRTPMQWSSDRNAGFSRAVPARLYSPVIMDPVYGYEAVNVEAQQSDPSSLLNWMRNMIALRKLFRVLGRGAMEVLPTSNRKVLAYLRGDGAERVLCVANLSRFAQPVSLDLARYEGSRPTEIVGFVDFPPIGRAPYPLTLGPYGFLWFELQPSVDTATVRPEAPPFIVGRHWSGVLPQPEQVGAPWPALREFLLRQRWFRKRDDVRSVTVVDGLEFDADRCVLLLDVSFEAEGSTHTYLLPLAFASAADAGRLEETAPNAVIQRANVAGRDGVLIDGSYDASCRRALLRLITSGDRQVLVNGAFQGHPGVLLPDDIVRDVDSLDTREPGADQSNTSLFFGDRLMLKLYRRVAEGVNPEREVGQFLSEQARFPGIAPYLGHLAYVREGKDDTTIALLQGFVPNEGDAWQWTLEELERYFEACAPMTAPSNAFAPPLPGAWLSGTVVQNARDHLGLYLDAATVLGTRTAELHVALATAGSGTGLEPERQDAVRLASVADQMMANSVHAIDMLKKRLGDLPDDVVEDAGLVLARRHDIAAAFRALPLRAAGLLATRVHGDLHLGQVLRVKQDFVVVDFEGEPTRPLDERRAKHSPLKDVAGMLGSFTYAAHAGLLAYTARRPESWERLEPWARLWLTAAGAEFLRAYLAVVSGRDLVPGNEEVFRDVLEAYLLDKSLYELRYELDHRPTWVRVPLKGILALTA